MSENIDAVRKLIMQDRHATYREIQASLGIASTSIHSILREHLAAKMISSHWIPHNLTIVQKKVRVDWCEEMLENAMAVLQKTFIRTSQVMNHASMSMSPERNNSPPCGPSKTSQIQRKLVVQKALQSLLLLQKWSCGDCSFSASEDGQL